MKIRFLPGKSIAYMTSFYDMRKSSKSLTQRGIMAGKLKGATPAHTPRGTL